MAGAAQGAEYRCGAYLTDQSRLLYVVDHKDGWLLVEDCRFGTLDWLSVGSVMEPEWRRVNPLAPKIAA